jgi:serine protease Do
MVRAEFYEESPIREEKLNMNETFRQPMDPIAADGLGANVAPRTEPLKSKGALRVQTWVAATGLLVASVAGGVAGAVTVAKTGLPAFLNGAPGPTASPLNAGAPPANIDQASPSGGFSSVVKATLPAVVNISTSKVTKAQPNTFLENPLFRDFFGDGQQPAPRQRREQSLGSGVVVNPDGYILTNNHVIDGATDIKVTFSDKRELKAKLVGADPQTDIAVLKVEEKNLPALNFGDSTRVQVGDFALAIGNPFGLGQTVTLGIVSATGRGDLGIEAYEDFIQTDAAINPGNSGGALVNSRGDLVGINTAIISRGAEGNQGIGFAVPINMARSIMDQLVKNGKVVRGYLGIELQNVDPKIVKQFALKDARGAIITNVRPDSPAEKAGFQSGDVIVELNGQPVIDVRTLRLSISQTPPGTSVKMKIVREGAQRELTAKLEELKDDVLARGDNGGGEGGGQNPAVGGALEGVSMSELTPQLRSRLGVSSGVLVKGVEPETPAEEAGLQSGDIILQVNKKPVANLAEFDAAIRQARGDQALLLISRGGVKNFIAVPLKR